VEARDLLHLAWVIPALPATGAVILLLVGRRIGAPGAGRLATAMMGLAFVASFVAFLALRSLPGEARADFAANVSQGYTWMKVGGLSVDFRFLVDPLSSTMTLFITGVGTLIHAYAIGYMHGDPRFSRFFAYLNLFAASMLVLVLGSGFVTTFMGWEGVGLCSYLLISFWFERESAAVAGKKAFVTNRIGDVGFLLAMFLIFQNLGSLSYGSVGAAPELPGSTVTAIALLLFVGAVGKSAQFPLHIWLPDAMEGPTPVSALIHAATMVTAGVFLVARAHPFFEASAHAGTVVAWVGAFTALFAASVAVVQNDIKRVLAWSTVSQLGYMFLAAGIGAYTAAIFLMVVHAFFKALLFLGAGSVIHGLHEEQDMRRMGRLQALMPVTAATFIVGWLAIAGVVPFAGFWAKDEVLAQAWFRGDYALWVVGLVGALLTAFYMTRQVMLVFFGNDRRDPEVHAHESPWIMLTPLVVLAGLSAVGGALNLPFTTAGLDFLHHWLEPVFHGIPEPHATSFAQGFVLSTVALTVAVAGILVAVSLYRRGLPEGDRDPVVERLGPVARVLENAYFVDRGIARLVSGPVTAFARFLAGPVDREVIDGAVDGVGETTRQLSGIVRRLQTGLVRNYALAIVLGAVLLILYVVTRATF
jgi:NADH-quinone oxidoreductase subunit L